MSCKKLINLMFFIIMFCLSKTTISGFEQNIKALSHIGASFKKVKVQGHYTYIGGSHELAIFDTIDPSHPAKIGCLPLPGSLINEIIVKDNLVFVANNSSGLFIVDVANPEIPVRCFIYKTPSYVYDIDVRDNIVYIADLQQGLYIVDIKDPYNPVLLGSYKLSGVRSISVSGNFALLGHNAISIIDVSDPSNPYLVGINNTIQSPVDIVTSGSLAYIADEKSGFYILDINNPYSPQIISFLNQYPATSVSIDGDIAGITEGDIEFSGSTIYGDTIFMINVSNPSVPAFLGSYKLQERPSGCFISERKIYAVDNGLYIINISKPESPSLYAFYKEISFRGEEVSISGNFAYIAAGTNGLLIYDVSNAYLPKYVSSFKTPSSATNLIIENNLAFIANDSSGLVIIDVNNPLSPSIYATFDTPLQSVDVEVSQGIAYLADADKTKGNILIIDTHDKTNLNLLANYTLSKPPKHLKIYDSNLFISLDDGGLIILDVSNPQVPQKAGFYNLDPVDYVIVKDNIACITHRTYGLKFLDISNVSSPSVLGTYNGIPYVCEPVWEQDYIYIPSPYNGLSILDASNLLSPMLIGKFYPPYLSTKYSVSISNGLCYYTGGTYGLFVLKHAPSQKTPPVITPFSNITLNESDNLTTQVFLTAGSPPIQWSLFSYSDPPDILIDAQTGIITWPYAFIDESPYTFTVSASNEAGKDSFSFTIDVLPKGNIELLGRLDTPGEAMGVVIKDDIAYIADGSSGLQIANVSNPYNPFIIGSFYTPGNVSDIAISAGLAFVAKTDTFQGGLEFIDVSNPTTPFLVWAYPKFQPTPFSTVAIIDNFVYAIKGNICFGPHVGSSSELCVFDTSNPYNPAMVSIYESQLYTSITDITFHKGNLFILEGTKGIGIYDNISSSSIVLLGQWKSPNMSPAKIAIWEDTAFLSGDHYSGLVMANISDPHNPYSLGDRRVSYRGPCYGIAASDNLVYLCATSTGLKIFNVSNPKSPVLVGSYNTPGNAWDVFLKDGLIYLADGANGLLILRYTGERPITLNTIKDYILKRIFLNIQDQEKADINKDSEIDISDMVRIISQ